MNYLIIGYDGIGYPYLKKEHYDWLDERKIKVNPSWSFHHQCYVTTLYGDDAIAFKLKFNPPPLPYYSCDK